MADGQVRVVTDDNFDEVVRSSDTPVLLDCWADWCGPCRLMMPVLGEIARENDARLTVGTLDVEANPRRTEELGVTSMPTLLLYVRGKLVYTFHGARPKSRLLGELAEHLGWS